MELVYKGVLFNSIGGAYSNAHDRWGQPSDTFSPSAVQSSMSEARMTGALPVEEVGSSLFSNKPLKSRSKFNLLQFVKGGSSSPQSTSHAQTAPGSLVSASWPLPLDEQPLSSLTSAGSTISGAASGLNLQTQYAASGSGHLVSTQGGSSSYPAELGVSGQSISDRFPGRWTNANSVHQSAEASILSESSGQGASSQGEGSYSGLSEGAPSPYTPGSLMSNKLDALPLGVSSQTTSSGSSYRAVSQVGSLSQVGASGQFASQRGNYYSGLLPQSQATSSQYALGYSKPISSPQSTSSQSASVLRPRKQYASGAQFGASTGFASQGMSSSYSGSAQSQGTTSQFAPGSPSPYDSLYCKCALSPQGVDRESTTVQSTHKQFTSRYGTQSGSSTPFTLQGSITYDRSPWPQGTASQLGPVSHSYPSVSSPSQGVSSQSTSVQFSRKQLASTYTGSSGTQAGSSPPFTPQGSTTYGGSPPPQDVASPFAPGPQSSYASLSLSTPQAGPSTTVQGSRKQFTSTFTGGSGTQSGSSTLLPLQGSTAYGGSPQRQDAASQLVRGWSAPYASLSLSSPQTVAGPSTVQGSRKRFTSPFTGGSGTQSGSSTPFTLQGSTAYGGSPQDVASPLHPGSSPYASVSLSSPQGAASKSSQSYQGYSVSQSQESQKWQPSATRLTQAIRTSDATASQGSSSSQSLPMQFSSLSSAGGSSAGGSSRVSGPFVSAHGGSTSYGGSFQSQSLSTKYTPGSQHLPYDAGVAGQGTSSASEVLSSYSSMNNQNAPAQPSYSVKG